MSSSDEKVDVFVVDDSDVDRKTMVKMLEEKYVVRDFRDGIDMLIEIHKTLPKVLILDWHLPLLEGDAVMVKFSEHLLFDKVRTLLVTADDISDEDMFRLNTLGVDEMYQKPFSKTPFLSAVESLFEPV